MTFDPRAAAQEAVNQNQQQAKAGNGRDPAPWIEPLDIIGAPELFGWPSLTSDCLPDPLYRCVTAEAERLNVDPCPLAAHVLAACATSISDAWQIKPKHHDPWTQQPRLWVCVVKDVGARGTEMIRTAFWPIRDTEKRLFDQYRQAYAAWMQRQAQRKKPDPNDPEPKCQRLTSQDATIEAASEVLKEGDQNAKLTLLCDELAAFFGGFGRYSASGAAGRALWLEAYDGGPQRIDRIRRGHVYVQNWSVVVAGNIQPRRLADMAKDLINDGLFQRFLTVHTRPCDLVTDDDVPLSAQIGHDYRDLHAALAALQPQIGAAGKPMPAYADADACAVRRAFMPLVKRLQVDPTIPTIIREAAPKWSGLLARLSLIFHLVGLAERQMAGQTLVPADLCCVTGPTVTTAATFLRRIALPNLFRLGSETMPEEGAPAGHARWLAGYILAHGTERITASEIGRAYRPLRGKPLDIAQAMAVLCDAGWATPAESRCDSARWAINPAVHVRFAASAALEKERRARVMQAIKQKVVDL